VEVTNSYGCKTTCEIEICVRDIRVPNNNGKVYVCHNGNTLAINSNAVSAHFPGHAGDQLGACNMPACPTASGSARMATNENQNVGEFIVSDELEMAVYPNPTNTEFNIRIESISTDFAEVRVFDLSGRIVERASAVPTNKEVTLGRNLSPGVYFVEVVHGDLSKKIKVIKL
jgi:hypothetical protein